MGVELHLQLDLVHLKLVKKSRCVDRRIPSSALSLSDLRFCQPAPLGGIFWFGGCVHGVEVSRWRSDSAALYQYQWTCLTLNDRREERSGHRDREGAQRSPWRRQGQFKVER
jgi:hypothetical protein